MSLLRLLQVRPVLIMGRRQLHNTNFMVVMCRLLFSSIIRVIMASCVFVEVLSRWIGPLFVKLMSFMSGSKMR